MLTSGHIFESSAACLAWSRFLPPWGDVLLFHRMIAREELSRLSEFEIDLLSEKSDIAPSKILAKLSP
jgi:uncharacterized protein involved in type VI secretion and phage assembly